MKNLLSFVIILTGIFTFGQQCNIVTPQIYEANQLGDGNVVFYTLPLNTNYSYKWEITLENGMVLSSVEPRAIYYISCDNRVTKAKVEVDNGSCKQTIERIFQPKVCGTAGLGVN